MASSVRIETGATEQIYVMVRDAAGAALTGKADLYIRIFRTSDGQFYDFNDDTFKAAGHVAITQVLTQRDATNAPGLYYWSGGFDTSAITNAAADDDYIVVPLQTPGVDAVFPDPGEVKEGQWVDDAIIPSISGSGAINTSANASSTITTGTAVGGTVVANTVPLDGVYWQIEDDAGTLDMYCEFDIGGDGSPVSATMTGRVNSANDSLDVYAYNWGATSWKQIGTLAGQGGTTDAPHTYTLLTTHVGTGANLGKVRVRFENTGLTGADLYIDQIFVSYAIIARSVGYANGAIWIDTVNGTAGTEAFVNGTADNPVLTLADAETLDTSLNLNRFEIAPGSSIQLDQAYDTHSFLGDNWNLDMNGKSLASSIVRGADIDGVAVAATPIRLWDCDFESSVTLPPSHAIRCGLGGVITLAEVGDYHLNECYEEISGASPPAIDFGVALGNTTVNFSHWSGRIELRNMGKAGTDVANIRGDGDIVLNANCIGGTINYRGDFRLIDGSSGTVVTRSDREQLQEGRWKIDAAANTLTHYDVDGTTPLRVLSLKDSAGLPTSTDVYERVPV